MTPADDSPNDMVERPEYVGGSSSLDEAAAERLLRGHRPTAGASRDELLVGRLLAEASAPPSAHELSGEARAVAAFGATRPATTGPRHARHFVRRRRPAFIPRVSHGVAAAAALGVLTVGGVAAAAYTGSLPASIQRIAHDHLGAPADQRATPRPERPVTSSEPVQTALRSDRPSGANGQPGLSAATPAPSPSPSHPASRGTSTLSALDKNSKRYQQCMAYATAARQQDDAAASRAFKQLVRDAGGRTLVFDYCLPVWQGAGVPAPDREPQDPAYPSQHPPLSTAPGSPNARPPH